MQQENPNQKVKDIRPFGRINKRTKERETVLLEQADNMAYPTIFPVDPNNAKAGWLELEGDAAFNEAKKRKEIFTFKTEREARDFAEGSWKDRGRELESIGAMGSLKDAAKNAMQKSKGSTFSYTFDAIAKKPKKQLHTLAKRNAMSYDFSKALGIDNKPKKANSNLDEYYNALAKLEYNGPDGLTARTNNPVATLYTDELAQKFGAKKGPPLPQKDNPENRALFTATFPTLESGQAAGKFIIKNIYDRAGGDVEKFASIYSMGKLPSQLIDSNEIAIKDRYVKALTSSTSDDDLKVTLSNQEDDVSTAVINETQRIIKGEDLFEGSTDISRLFDPTTRMLNGEPADIRDFAKASTTKTGVKDIKSLVQFEESVVPITPVGEGIVYPKEFTQLEEQATDLNQKLITMSNAPDAPTGINAWKTMWQNAFGASPDDDTVKALAVNILSNAGEIVAGLSDLKDKAVVAIATGEGGLEFAEEFVAGFAATPEILSNLIVAAGVNPLPQYNNSTPEGKKRVLEAQQEVWNTPLMPILSAVGLKAAGAGVAKAPALVKKYAEAGKSTINELVAINESALKIAKGEANKGDYSLATNKIAEAITNPAVFENTLKVLKEGKPFEKQLKGGYSPKQVKQALGEIKTLAETYFETINALNNPYVLKPLTENQRIGMQNSANQLRASILKQSRIVGDDATITQLQGGFGLFKPDAKVLLEYIKGIKKELPELIMQKVMGFQKDPKIMRPDDELSPNVKDAVDHMRKTSHENKINAESNKPTWQKIKGNLAQWTYDVGAKANFAIDKAIKKSGGEESAILKQVRIEKDLINGTSARSEFYITQLNSTVYDKLNKPEQVALNRLINIRRERSLKKFHDAEVVRLNNQLKVETKKSEIKKINDELQRIDNYDYSGGNAWIRPGVVKDWLAETNLKSSSKSKVVNAADDYFDVYRGLIDEMEDVGLITPEEAVRYKARDYSPKKYLQFIKGEKTYDILGKKITVTDRGIKKLREGDEGVLYDNTRLLLYDTIRSVDARIQSNKALNMLATALRKGEVEGIGYLLKNANTRTKPGYARVEYFDKGVKKAIALDETFASGWIKQDSFFNQKALKWLSWASGSKILKASATGMNPLFAITNVPLDMAYITLTQHGLYSNFIPKAYLQLAGDMARVSIDAGKKFGKRKIDYVNEGGMMNTLTSMGRFGDPFKPANTKIGKGVRFAESILGKVGEWSELTTRLAIRERAIKNGLSPKEATWMARNYLDFSKQGQITRTMEMLIPYSGASVQATRGLLRSMGKKDFYIKASQLAALQFGIRYYINSSKEAKETYGRISDDIKYRNFVIPLPFKVTDKTGKKRSPYLKIRKDGGQSLITGLYDMTHNVITKERTSDYNMDQLRSVIDSFTPYEISGMAPTINAIFSWGNNRKFPWNSKIYKGDDRVTEGRVMTNLDEDLIWKDLGNAMNISPAKLQYTSDKFTTGGNFFADVGFGTYDYLRNEMSEEELEQYDRNFQKYIDMPMSDIPGIRKIPSRFLGFADDVDVALKREIKEQESDKANIIGANNNEVDSFLLYLRTLGSKEDKSQAIKDMDKWLLTVGANFGEGEKERVTKRINERAKLENLDLVKGLVELTQNETPSVRAYSVAREMIKYKEDPKYQDALLEELYKISPIKRNKRTGYLNDETIKYFNAIMESYKKGGILKNPIFIE